MLFDNVPQCTAMFRNVQCARSYRGGTAQLLPLSLRPPLSAPCPLPKTKRPGASALLRLTPFRDYGGPGRPGVGGPRSGARGLGPGGPRPRGRCLKPPLSASMPSKRTSPGRPCSSRATQIQIKTCIPALRDRRAVAALRCAPCAAMSCPLTEWALKRSAAR